MYKVDEVAQAIERGDPEIKTTAWRVGADWNWQDKYNVFTKRAKWTDAQISQGYQGVRFQRLVGGATINDMPHIVTRYLKPEYPVTLKLRRG